MKLLTPPYLLRVIFSSIAVNFLSSSIAESIERISVTANGDEVAGYFYVTDITPDGRYVVFDYTNDDLVPGDSNGQSDVFVLDRTDGSVELISVNSNEDQPTDESSSSGSISNDGRYVAFESRSSQLVPSDVNGNVDVFVRDRQGGGNTTRVSLSDGEMQLSGNSRGMISGNGQFVVFTCDSDDAVMGDTNGGQDVFRRDLVVEETIRVSVSDGGMEPVYSSILEKSFSPTISDDGNRIGFLSGAENLITDDDNMHQDMFVRDVAAGTTTRVSLTSTGTQQENGGTNEIGVISANGLTIAFGSSADNLLPGITVEDTAVYVREIAVNNLELVSIATSPSSSTVTGFSSFPTISPDGRYVGFQSTSDDLDNRKTTGFLHGYIRDRQSQQTATVNISTTGQFANNASGFDSGSEPPLFADSGVYVFSSDSDELVPGDTDETNDVYQSEFIPVPPAVAAPAAPSNLDLCGPLKKKLKKLKKKLKKAKRAKQIAKAKRFKKKIKKIKKKLKALGC